MASCAPPSTWPISCWSAAPARRASPSGVAPDLAREIATRLGCTVAYVPFARPGELADAAGQGIWDIGLIAAEPARCKRSRSAPPTPRSPRPTWCPRARRLRRSRRRPPRRAHRGGREERVRSLAEPPSSARRAGRAPGLDAAYELFVDQKLDALAGLRPRLLSDIENCPAPASWMGSSPPSSRRSARRGGTRRARRSCATSLRRRSRRA